VKRTTTLLLAILLAAPASATKGTDSKDWYQWRGPNRDGLSPDTGLLKQWPSGGPPLAWKITGVGAGFSSVSIVGDRVYTMGDLADGAYLIALNLADGKPVWQCRIGETGASGGYPGPRCTPASDGTLVFALGQFGEFLCAEAATGKEKWRKDLKKEFGGKMMSGWGYSESPLLDGDLVVCTPGGSKGTLLALKKATGDTVWQSAEFTDRAAYASLVPAEIGGVRQYLVLTDASVAGIAAKDGKRLWRAARKGATAVIPTPIYKDGLMFVASGYGIGCNAFKVTADGGEFKAEEVYSGKQVQNHHGGIVLVGEHLYELDDSGRLKCVEFKTGKEVWADRCVGKGSIAYADGHLICRSEGRAGALALVEATPEGYKEKGRFDQPDRSKRESWPHPVIFGGRMYIRDQDVLLCYDVKAK
jgi:outer membrane protein assembly factor BamB